MPHKGKVRYRRREVGRKGFHYLQLAYRGNELVEATLKPYKGKKGHGVKEKVLFFKK
jgi:hypothetical protein